MILRYNLKIIEKRKHAITECLEYNRYFWLEFQIGSVYLGAMDMQAFSY